MSLIIRLKFFLISIWNNITIEPVVLLYLTSVGLTSVIRPNLIIDKACRIKLNLTEEIGGNLTDISDSDNANVVEVQKVVAEYESTLNLVATLPRVTFTLLAGPWSDRHGRKLLILVPIFGQAITALTYILNVKYFNQLPFEALYMELINELSGNFVVYYLGIYSYMADITSFDVRTSRLGILDGTDYISTMLGTYISGPVFENLGYFAVFSASLVLAVCGVLYVWILVAESKSKVR
jgi:MFS family permease